MKNIVKLLSLLLIVCCFTCLFSCSSNAEKPTLDILKARSNLEKRHYYTEIEREFDSGYSELSLKLTAYDEDDLYKASLVIYEFVSSKVAEKYYNMITAERNVRIKQYEAQIEYWECLLEKHSEEITSVKIDEIKDRIKSYKKAIQDIENGDVIGYSGKYVWHGTLQAIVDTK
ncbi:MAG: hypothetical protein IKC33_02295 [Clostridia bacterium]|nr:hypothetical protein [Clostridia bacterium]MBR6687215.1 hypothetical protein [Clostridia bacterium]